MDSYEALHTKSNSSDEPEIPKNDIQDQKWVKFVAVLSIIGHAIADFFTRNVFFTLTGHEYRLGFQARVQKIWFYFSVFYGLLMLITLRSVASVGSLLSFFS